jgi:hypothetical protein
VLCGFPCSCEFKAWNGWRLQTTAATGRPSCTAAAGCPASPSVQLSQQQHNTFTTRAWSSQPLSGTAWRYGQLSVPAPTRVTTSDGAASACQRTVSVPRSPGRGHRRSGQLRPRRCGWGGAHGGAGPGWCGQPHLWRPCRGAWTHHVACVSTQSLRSVRRTLRPSVAGSPMAALQSPNLCPRWGNTPSHVPLPRRAS